MAAGIHYQIAMREVLLPKHGARIVSHEALQTLNNFVPVVHNDVRAIMRRGATGQERSSLVTTVMGIRNPTLRSSSSAVQAAVDETGRRAGPMPPFGPGSLLREWVIAILAPSPRKVHATAKGVAYQIAARGLPRPDDPLRAPFRTVFEAHRAEVIAALRRAGDRAAIAINRREELRGY
jgi:hypothetical protein